MFDVIRDILKTKNGKSLDRNDFDDAFNLYMIQRWISMYSDLSVEILNVTVNTLYNTLDDRQQFELMSTVLHRNQMKGVYIKAKKKKKATKKSKNKDVDDINILDVFEESSAKMEESLKFVLGEINE